jgi:hypothetical protein
VSARVAALGAVVEWGGGGGGINCTAVEVKQ